MPAELSISISEGLMTKLNSLADETQRSREELVAVAVQRFVEDDVPFRAQMLRGIRESGAGMFIPGEEVDAWIDSLGTRDELSRPTARMRTS